jgi:hypothetical protein
MNIAASTLIRKFKKNDGDVFAQGFGPASPFLQPKL